MAVADFPLVPRRREEVGRVLPHRLEHPEPGVSEVGRAGHERGVEQLLQRVRRLDVTRDELERPERRAAAERPEHGEQFAFLLTQELHAPVERRAERPLAFRQVAGAAGEEREPLPEALGRALGTERPHASRCELECEREAVERAAIRATAPALALVTSKSPSAARARSA